MNCHDYRCHVFAESMRVCTLVFELGSGGPQFPGGGGGGQVGYELDEVYYHHGDHLGSAQVTTNANGNVARRDTYFAYGTEDFVGSGAFDPSNRFTGQVLDADTGLYYYKARYYDPVLGR